jgi:spermidine/putrescine-binding protein
MKKLVSGFLVVFMMVVLAACGSSDDVIYVLNWGDYINPDLIDAFEEETGIRIVYEEAGGNEEFDIRLRLGTTPYDIIIPSDYMMDKWAKNGLIQRIDLSLIPNYDKGSLIPEAVALYENEEYYPYMIPYFFGTFGLMYNTRAEGIEEAIQSQGYGVLFDPNSPYRVGLYDSPRDTMAAALIHLGYSVNTTDAGEILEAENLIKNVPNPTFGGDTLKQRIIEGNLDVALVYSGDYFDEMYAHEAEELEINFAFYTPDFSNAWIDGIVIPENARNVEGAHAFINFMIDLDNAYENASYVGYTPVILSIYETILEEFELDESIFFPFPSGATRQIFQYISEEHLQALSDAFNRAKSN